MSGRLRDAIRKLTGDLPPPATLIPEEYIQLLYDLVKQTISLSGDLIEVGVYKGGSLYRIADYLKREFPDAVKKKKLIGIDTFTGHPDHDPSIDPPHHWKGRFSDTSFRAVHGAVRRFDFVQLIQGECQDVFASMAADAHFCFGHIDVDIAKASIQSTEFLFPRLSPGGVLVYDEYQGYGQEPLLNEYFLDKPVRLQPRNNRASDNYGMIVYKLQ